MKSGQSELNKHLISAMSKLLRLKQACCHVSMVKRNMNVQNWAEFAGSLEKFLINSSKEWRKGREAAIRAELVDGTCAICFESLESCAVLAKCGHLYCASCIDNVLGSTKTCPECRADWKLTQDFSSCFKLVPNDLFEQEVTGWKDSSKTKMVLNIIRKFILEKKLDTNVVPFKTLQNGVHMESTLIDNMPTENAKIVIFSQFNKMLDILEKSFKENHMEFKYTRIDGSCNKDKRQERIKQFKTDSEVKVLLAT